MKGDSVNRFLESMFLLVIAVVDKLALRTLHIVPNERFLANETDYLSQRSESVRLRDGLDCSLAFTHSQT